MMITKTATNRKVKPPKPMKMFVYVRRGFLNYIHQDRLKIALCVLTKISSRSKDHLLLLEGMYNEIYSEINYKLLPRSRHF